MPKEIKTTELGVRIRTYRIRHRMTQEKLAYKLGVNRNTIHLWETHRSKPSIGAMLQLSELLKEPLSEIVRLSESYCVVCKKKRGRPRRGDQALRAMEEDGTIKAGCEAHPPDTDR